MIRGSVGNSFRTRRIYTTTQIRPVRHKWDKGSFVSGRRTLGRDPYEYVLCFGFRQHTSYYVPFLPRGIRVQNTQTIYHPKIGSSNALPRRPYMAPHQPNVKPFPTSSTLIFKSLQHWFQHPPFNQETTSSSTLTPSPTPKYPTHRQSFPSPSAPSLDPTHSTSSASARPSSSGNPRRTSNNFPLNKRTTADGWVG